VSDRTPHAAPADPAAELAAVRLELDRMQRLFRSAFHHQFQFMAVLTPDGRVVDFNQQFAPGSVVPREEIVGRLFWDAVWFRHHPEIVAAWPARLAAAAASAGPTVHHDRFTSSDGEERWAEAAVNALRDAAGRIEGFIVQATDTTEQRRAEALRSEVEQRLREAQKLHAIGTLAGGIAHDFNNILGAIRGNLALAADTLPPGHAAAQPLAQIERASLRGRSLVRQILAFSRNEPGELRAAPLQPLVEEAVALLDTLRPPRARLQTALAPVAVWANVNATQIHQVMMNLCTNAFQALRDGAGTVTIGVDAGDGQGAHLWVADDGCGMDDETRRRVFEPFFTTKPVDLGTGLGLSVVHGIALAHGGTVEIDSALGRGTTVHLLLPAAERAAAPAASQAAAGSVPDGAGRHVLYLDDDEVMAPLAGQLLRRGGWRVSTFTDADAALATLLGAAHDVDIVVTDFNMPGHNGLEVIRRIAAHAPDLPVVLTSGYIDDALRAQAAALGVRQLLHKENLREDLCAAVHAAWQARRG
jgi:PAS domain S-box-containing protein